MTDNSILEKITSAAGVIFDPEAPKRRAEAEVEAMRIKAEGEKEAAVIKAEGERDAKAIEAQGKREAGMIEAWGKLTPAEQRALGSIIGQQMKYQANIEKIAEEARPLVDEGANPKNIDDTWAANVHDKAKGVFDEDMRKLWAGILAGEINKPGSYSKRAVNILANLSHEDVLSFENLCKFRWNIEGKFVLIILNERDGIYKDHGIDLDVLMHLDSLGLIQQAQAPNFILTQQAKVPLGYVEEYPSENLTASYFERDLSLNAPNRMLPTGKSRLTKAGCQLARLTNPSPVEGFCEYSIEEWREFGITLTDETK